jgi:hypothetical protein
MVTQPLSLSLPSCVGQAGLLQLAEFASDILDPEFFFSNLQLLISDNFKLID